MLVLTRKLGEGIAIGEDIRIVVMQIKGKQVRLGIKAKATTAVYREEVYQKIHDENKLAATSDKTTLSLASRGLALAPSQISGAAQNPLRTRKRLVTT